MNRQNDPIMRKAPLLYHTYLKTVLNDSVFYSSPSQNVRNIGIPCHILLEELSMSFQ